MNTREALEMLGHPESAARTKIVFREFAMIHHPDKGGDEDAMRVLNDVYTKLKKARRK